MAQFTVHTITAPTGATAHITVTGTVNRELVTNRFYLGVNSTSTGVGRILIYRASTAPTGTARAPEKHNSRTSAFHGTVHQATTANPTLAANPILILHVGRAVDRHGKWTPPRSNAGVYCLDGTERVTVVQALDATQRAGAFNVTIADSVSDAPGHDRLARRPRTRQGYFCRSVYNECVGGVTLPRRVFERVTAHQVHPYWSAPSKASQSRRALDDAGGGAGDATVSPAAIATIAAAPAPAVSTGATPAAVAAVASMPAPTARGGTTSTPTTIAALATIPTPTPLTGTVRTPAAIAAAAAVGDPDVSVGTAPTVIAATSTVPTPTAGQTGGGGATATPAAVAATSTVPQPAVAVGAAPASVTATATVPTPTALTGARATPAAVAAVAAVPAPAVAVGAAPATVAAVAALPAPTVLTGTGAAPATISTTTTVPKPNVSVGAAPAPIAATVTMPAPSIVVVFTVAPATVLLAVTVPAPRVAVGAAPATVAVVVAIGTPTIPGSGTGLWSWYLRRAGVWLPASPKVDGVHPTTTDVT